MFESIFNKLSVWAKAIVNIVVNILNRMINFFSDIVDWFRSKLKGAKKKIAFVITLIKLQIMLGGIKGTPIKNNTIGDVLKDPNIPVINIGLHEDKGVANVIYDEEKDEVSEICVIGTTQGGIDENLQKAMKDKDIIKLA